MRRTKAFTLVEMLAVVSIMLILLAATFGIFGALAEQTGPDTVMATVQAMIHNARDYAATTGYPTRIEFRSVDRRDNPLESGTMMLQHLPPDENSFRDIPGGRPVELPRGMFVLNGIPSGIPQAPTVGTGDVSDRDVAEWRRYESNVYDKYLTPFALSGTDIKSAHQEFYVEFGPGGYRPANPQTSGTLVEFGMTIVRVTGRRVVNYAFYRMNPNTGTRLVFE